MMLSGNKKTINRSRERKKILGLPLSRPRFDPGGIFARSITFLRHCRQVYGVLLFNVKL
jgi:hypothetical protein